jgi:predicted nucleic acid-binding protein
VIVLDASVLIGFLDDQGNHHALAQQLLADAADDDLAVNSLTLAEILVAPARDGHLDQVLAALRALDVTELAFPVDTAVRLAHLRVTTGLKLPDCCVILAAEDAGGRIASFDDRLAQAAETRNLTVLRS